MRTSIKSRKVAGDSQSTKPEMTISGIRSGEDRDNLADRESEADRTGVRALRFAME